MEFLYKILHIDLNKGENWVGKINIEDYLKYLPSRGISAKLLWELTDENTDPLGEDNVLIFGPGAFTGTIAPCSGRTTVTFKSPLTGMYFKSNTGGHWGAALKHAGYGHLVIHGKAEAPVYILIEDDEIEIKDGRHLWGKDVRTTNKVVKEELGDEEVQLVTIGPAGENLVKIASLMFSTYNAAARGGGGAVMGSKNLKAIAVKGTKGMRIDNGNKFYQLCLEASESIKKDSGYEGLARYGTSGSVIPLNELGAMPTKNFQKCHFKDCDKISGEALVESGRLKRRIACYSCIIGCHRYTETNSSRYYGFGGGPELETICAFGAGTEVSDIDAIIKANELCNIYGLDTISTGRVIQWAMECYDKGIFTIENTNGIELEWGNGEAMVKMIENIAMRKGLGNLLSNGVKRAAEKIGKGSEKFAIEAKGLEQSSVDTRIAKGYALAFAVNLRGADHLHTETFAELGLSQEGRDLVKKITGCSKFIESTKTDKRAEIVRWHEDCFAVSDALGFCAFTTTALYGITPKSMADMWSTVIDREVSEEKLMEAGRRIVTLEKAYNVRCGATRNDDRLPWRLMNEDAEDRYGGQFMANTQEELDIMLDEYYRLHDWDLKTSWPTRKTLEKLGLNFVAEELGKKGKLPSLGNIKRSVKA